MMRFVAVGLAAMLAMSTGVSAAVAGNVNSPNTPPDGTQDVQGMCLLSSMTFTNGFQLVGDFKYNVFNYQCSCAKMTGATTSVVPAFMDVTSSAEVTFNNNKINFRTTANAISRNGAVANSPKTRSDDLTLVAGANTIVVGVGCNGYGKDSAGNAMTCYYQYTIKCNKGSYVVGDPMFVGLRGQNYQVHGVSNHIYNIISDKDLQYNSRFVFLNSGKCPVVDGVKQKGCWSHPGSYLGELALKTRAGDRVHIKTGSAKHGFQAIEINGKAMEVGESVVLADNMGSVSLNSTHLVSVNIGNWDFAFENSDHFVNQRVHVIDSRGLRAHGLLGQTWRETTYPNSVKYVQGEVEDYAVHDDDMFGDNFVFNNHN